jgi:hypothetical protein
MPVTVGDKGEVKDRRRRQTSSTSALPAVAPTFRSVAVVVELAYSQI